MIRVAVVGAGYIAREHLDCLRSLPTVEVVAVCDRSPTIAEATADEFGIPAWFTDHERLLSEERPAAVHVTTPPQSHTRIVSDALDAGAHVVVEKPIVTDFADLERLGELARARNLFLLEDHNYRFNPSILRIRDWIASGAFGEVVHVDVFFAVAALAGGGRLADARAPDSFSTLPGGPVFDFLTHLAYLASSFIGPHESVTTRWSRRLHSDAPWDEFRALVAGSRATASLGFSASSQPDAFTVRVHGTRMRATANLFEPLVRSERLHAGPRPLVPVRNGVAGGWTLARSSLSGLWRKLRGEPITYAGLWELLRRFYHAIESGEPCPIDWGEIAETNRLVWEMLDQEPGRCESS